MIAIEIEMSLLCSYKAQTYAVLLHPQTPNLDTKHVTQSKSKDS